MSSAFQFYVMPLRTIFCIFLLCGSICCWNTTLDELYVKLKKLVNDQSQIASMSAFTVTSHQTLVYVIRIHSGRKRFPPKKRVFLEFGIHGREWASYASAVFFVQQILTDKYRTYTDQIEWFIVPVMNPDGYHYTMTENDMWRKNRQHSSGKCVGVDLNRNFPVGWKMLLAKNACETIYSGSRPLSEKESRGLYNLMKQQGMLFDAYVAIHSCAQGVYYPYGYTVKKKPRNVDLLSHVAHLMKAAIQKVNGKIYAVNATGSLGDGDDDSGGGTDDWAYDDLSIPLVFTLELGYMKTSGTACFHPTDQEMDSLVRECFAAVTTLADYLISDPHKPERLRNDNGSTHEVESPYQMASTAVEGFPVSSKLLVWISLLILCREV